MPNKDIEELEASVDALKVENTKLRADVDQAKSAQGGSDRANTELTKQNYKLSNDLMQMGDPKEMIERMNRIEASADRAVGELKIKHYTEIQCIKAGVDYALVEKMPFKNEEEVNHQIGLMADFKKKTDLEKINEMLLSNTKPSSGEMPRGNTRPAGGEGLTGGALKEFNKFLEAGNDDDF